MTARPFFIVGNWKMNMDLESIKKFFLKVDGLKFEHQCEAWVAPQFIHLPIVKQLAFTLGKMNVGAQNCSEHKEGAFTGETSAQALKDMGSDFVILGHSERRQHFKESNELLNAKCLTALGAGLKVIFCIGETLAQREAGQTFSVLSEQVEQGLKDLTISKDQLLIAYEPVWAIGTGKTATSAMIAEVHLFLQELLAKKFPGHDLALLYGGSVKPENLAEILHCPHVHGALVGGASLSGEGFAQMLITATQVQRQKH